MASSCFHMQPSVTVESPVLSTLSRCHNLPTASFGFFLLSHAALCDWKVQSCPLSDVVTVFLSLPVTSSSCFHMQPSVTMESPVLSTLGRCHNLPTASFGFLSFFLLPSPALPCRMVHAVVAASSSAFHKPCILVSRLGPGGKALGW